ncbi:MAG: hypothetical protein WCS99_18290 [Limisphaerales bacterium]
MNTEQSAYWHIVQETLETFHRLSRQAATTRIQRFRMALLETGDPVTLEYAMHEEPFYLAARLAGRKVAEPTPAQDKIYSQILKRCTEEAIAFGALAVRLQETKKRLSQIETKAAGVLRRKKPAEFRRQKLVVPA